MSLTVSVWDLVDQAVWWVVSVSETKMWPDGFLSGRKASENPLGLNVCG